MPAAIGNATLSANNVNASSITFAHNNNGSTLIVGGGSETGLSGATYAGSAMAIINEIWDVGQSDIGVAFAIWKHLTPAAGSNNVVVTGTGSDNMLGMAISVVDAGDVRSDSSATGNNPNPSTTPASTNANDIVVDIGVHSQIGTYTPGANQTSLGTTSHTPGGWGIFGSWQDGADGAAMTSTMSNSHTWRVSAVSVQEGAGGARDGTGPIVFKSAGPGDATETSGVDVSTFAGTCDAGDILIAHLYFEGTTTSPTTPSGWTLLSGPHVIETTIARHWVYGKIADGTEDVVPVTFGTQAVTTMRGMRIYVFSGRVAGAIEDLVSGFAHLSHATDPAMPTVTTTQTGALAVALTGQNDNNAQISATGETGGDWVEAVAEYTAALTPGLALALQTATPTGNPGTITGGTVATTNDPVGVIGFEIRHTYRSKDIMGRPYGQRGQQQMQQLLAT